MVEDQAFIWPDNKKAAVLISVETDAEFIFLSLSPRAKNSPKTLSMGQYGMIRGLKRVLDVLEQFNIKATFFVPGRVAEIYPDKIAGIAEKGHEIACHGYEHENFGLITIDRQKEVIEKASTVLASLVGKKPIGFRLPEGDMTPETLPLLRKMGFLYDCSLHNNDVPYVIDDALVEIPMHWELQDFPYFMFNFEPPIPDGQCRIANYSDVLQSWIDEFDAYRKHGLCFVLKVSPESIGSPGRIAIFERLLNHITAFDDIWIATGAEIAAFCQRK